MKISSKLLRIKSAIETKTIADLTYHKIKRQAEIHILGYDFDNKSIIRIFELTRDGKTSNQFKLYFVSDISSLKLTKLNFTRTVTKDTDQAMKKVIISTYTNEQEKEKT